MIIETRTYRFQANEVFSGQQIEFEGGSIWHAEADRALQVPILNFALSEVVDVTEGFGTEGGYAGAVRRYFDTKRQGVVSSEDTAGEIQGLAALIRTSISTRDVDGASLGTFHLFVNIRLDDGFMQEFSADCPLEQRERYEPLFWEAIRSVEWTGDRRSAIDAQEAARAAVNERLNRLTARAEALAAGVAAEPRDLGGPPEPEPFEIPAGNDPVMAIAGMEFDVDEDRSKWSIASFSHELAIKIVGRTQDAKGAEGMGLLSDYPGGGEVQFSLGVKGVLGRGGVPAGVFSFEDGKCIPQHFRVTIEGTDYGLQFSGNLTLEGAWVGLQGSLGRSYESNRFAVDIRVPLDPGALHWGDYQYTSVGELSHAMLEEVRHVSFQGGDLTEFPEILLGAKNLESLSLWRRPAWGAAPDPPALPIPVGLSRLRRLQELHVANYEVPELPDLSKLTELTKVYLIGTGLRAVPQGLMGLPNLRFLTLSGNELQTLPEAVSLPQLEALDVSKNQLVDLPKAYCAQPRLARMDLGGNPWESLPNACADFKLSLSIEEKRRLLDYEYRGADGLGTVPWDESVHHLAAGGDRMGAIDALIAEQDLGSRADAIRYLSRPSVGFRHAGDEDYARVGGHRFGGMPDLPPTVPYPRYGTNENDGKSDYAYEFIAQINLGEIAPLQDYLPRSGMLYFFLTTHHDLYGGDAEKGPRVLYHPGDVSAGSLVSGKALQFDEEDYFEMMGPGYSAFRAEAAAAVSFPSLYAAGQNPHLFRGPAASLKGDEEFLDDLAMDQIEEPLRKRYPHDHEMGGHCFSQSEHPEHQAALAFRGAPEDWVVLLKVGSEGDFQWGDAGDLFYVIHKSDLAKGDFSKIFCGLESS